MADMIKSMMEDKVAIITGAAQGIGLEIARVLAQAGVRVALIDLNKELAQHEDDQLHGEGYEAMHVATDVSDETQVKAMVQEVRAKWGRVDILVNNAGICPITPVEAISAKEWDLVLSVNLKSAFLCSQAVIPAMREQGRGKIINIASSAGQMGGLAVGLHYSASKAGMFGLTKGLARILAPDIQVNAVSPGTTESEMTSGWTQQAIEDIAGKIPAGRLGRPADVAAAVCFLVSDEADFITGQTLSVNGGLLMV